MIFSGVVTVAPAQQRGIVVRTTDEQPGSPIGFYVPEAFGVALDGAVAVVEATPTQVVVDGRTQMATAYGVGDVDGAPRRIRADARPGLAVPHLHVATPTDLAARRALPGHVQHPV